MSTKLIHVNPELVKKLRIIAAIKDIGLQEAANEAIDQYIKKNGDEKYADATR
ncbi:MAG: hypothetical protein AB9895_00100 [Negativicutes bacterium]